VNEGHNRDFDLVHKFNRTLLSSPNIDLLKKELASKHLHGISGHHKDLIMILPIDLKGILPNYNWIKYDLLSKFVYFSYSTIKENNELNI